ncbi:MAG: xanthine dehydrogenase family protein subunit M [Defluviicoccus sp.]|nr:xanthine dehydrogenase family protein subunit M [Defluviicoccus sp.]MDE0382639.1 xanthine dehydrogenase family protein subunit M [Defluviicoccus sp.]
MKAPRFAYTRPDSLDEVLALLAEHGDEARILAGGQSLMPTLNMRLSRPSLLIDINRIDALKGIGLDNGTIRIGALARHAEVMGSDIVAERLPLVADAMPHVAHVAIRNRGTFGGSIALADPAAELPACALALDAEFVLASARGRRTVAAGSFFNGLYETERGDDEILVETRIPAPGPGYRSSFMELARRHGDFALAGVCCHARVEGGALSDVRLAYFGSDDRPRLAQAAAAAAEGKPWSEDVKEAVKEALGGDLDPIGNFHASAATRLHLARVLTGRALDRMVASG